MMRKSSTLLRGSFARFQGLLSHRGTKPSIFREGVSFSTFNGTSAGELENQDDPKKLPQPRRFMDAVHMNRVDRVKKVISHREEEFLKKKELFTYDILEMDLEIKELKEEDNKTANEIMEDARDMIHRSDLPLDIKRDRLLTLKELLGDPDMWYTDMTNTIYEKVNERRLKKGPRKNKKHK